MASRRDYYFRQIVAEDELDAGFTGLEDAERNSLVDPGFAAVDLDTDHGGIHSGMLPTLSGGLTVAVPTGTARDRLGRRVVVPAAPAIALDLSKTGTTNVGDGGTPIGGVSTFPGAGLKRWVALFVFFDRELSVPRTDGTGAEVFFVRDESFRFFVSQGVAAATPTDFVPQQPGMVRLMDFRVTDAGTIDLTNVARRQVWLRAVTGAAPTSRVGAGFPIRGLIAESGIRAAFEQLLGYYNDHVNPAVNADAHTAAGTAYVAGETWHDGTQLGAGAPSNIQAAIDAVQTDLKSNAGSDKIGSAAVVGSVDSLGVGSVLDQLSDLLSFVNDRLELSASAGVQTVIDGIIINASTVNAPALDVTGNGTGAGIDATGGASGPGVIGTGGASGGAGGQFTGGATGSGVGITVQGGFPNGIGAQITPGGSGIGVDVNASSGIGVDVSTTSGIGVKASTAGGDALEGNVVAGVGHGLDVNLTGTATGIAVTIDSVATANPALQVQGSTSTALASFTNSGSGYGVHGVATAAAAAGVRGDTSSASGYGVWGIATTAGGYGVRGDGSVGGVGVAGIGSNGTSGSAGILALAGNGTAGAGGEAIVAQGGTGTTVGGHGINATGGAGPASLGGAGLFGTGGTGNGVGVLGVGDGGAAPATFQNQGVLGVGGSSSGTGVRGVAGTNGVGVQGFSSTGSGAALDAQAASGTGYGVLINRNTTRAAIHLDVVAGDPSTLANSDIWYNSTSHRFKGRRNGTTTFLDVTDASDLSYTPGSLVYWGGSAPTDTADALNRLAIAVDALGPPP